MVSVGNCETIRVKINKSYWTFNPRPKLMPLEVVNLFAGIIFVIVYLFDMRHNCFKY